MDAKFLATLKSVTKGVITTLSLYPVMAKNAEGVAEVVHEDGRVELKPILNSRNPSIYQSFFMTDADFAKLTLHPDVNGLSFVRADISGIGHVTDMENESGRKVAWCDVKSCRDAYRERTGVKSTNAAGAPAEIALPTF